MGRRIQSFKNRCQTTHFVKLIDKLLSVLQDRVLNMNAYDDDGDDDFPDDYCVNFDFEDFLLFHSR